ncbi:FAD-dependent thymidylate synthase [Paraburkholderia nemoris]|uniref:FAD-dependent thymidylate synthase n=1 Tax=Paraburkholderia nemoris TaxID=2793076 RepID=UPI0038B8375A
MTIEAKVIEDSIGRNDIRLATLQLRYPRFIHSELMTHRVFSRNASSSRAIPVAKMIEQVRNDPAMPVHWGLNQPGMQAKAEQADWATSVSNWRHAASSAADRAEALAALGLHKQVVNRVLEPFLHISVVVTATEWANFFELRDHEDAQPEIRELAVQMKRAMGGSNPVYRGYDQNYVSNWHLPYITREERELYAGSPWFLAEVSAARCARVSYLTHDGQQPDMGKDKDLFERLVGSRPLHASPTEHQGFPIGGEEWCKNFRGWFQFRQAVEDNMREAA